MHTGMSPAVIVNLALPAGPTSSVWGKHPHDLLHRSIAAENLVQSNLAERPAASRQAARVTAVFGTHEHGDHHAGLRHFGGADWYAAPEAAGILNGSGKCNKAVIPAGKHLLERPGGIRTLGHTPYHHSLRFECEGREALIGGDGVTTRDFWRDRRGYFNSADPVQASRTIEMLAGTADVIVPGHDNYFLNDRG